MFVCLYTVIQGNDKLSAKYHKGFWVDGVFLCCGQAVKNAPGCCDWHKGVCWFFLPLDVCLLY